MTNGATPAAVDAAGPSGGRPRAGDGAADAADRSRASGAERAGLTATAGVAAGLEAGRARIRWTQAWPIVLRPTGNTRVHLVHGAGGPLGGDVLALDVRVGTGAALAVRSAAATVVQPGRGSAPARWDFDVVVDAGGSLDWAPEPTVVTDGADYRTSLRVNLDVGARAIVREVVVLGRHGGVGGRYRGRLDVAVDGNPLLAHTTLLDGADPALCGPGGVAGARAVGTLLLVDAAGATPAGDGSAAAATATATGSATGATTGAASGAVSPASGIAARPPGREVGAAVAAGPTAIPTGADDLQGDAAPVGERAGVRWAWTDLPGPGRALFAVGEPGAVIALLDAAAG